MMRHLLFLSAFLVSLSAFSQEQPEMADALRQDGKYWVVITCVCIILFGLLAWIFLLDRKITKIEKEQLKK